MRKLLTCLIMLPVVCPGSGRIDQRMTPQPLQQRMESQRIDRAPIRVERMERPQRPRVRRFIPQPVDLQVQQSRQRELKKKRIIVLETD